MKKFLLPSVIAIACLAFWFNSTRGTVRPGQSAQADRAAVQSAEPKSQALDSQQAEYQRAALQRPESTEADVIVFGATPGGISAAVTAKRAGSSVILLEPSRHIGGMISGGLGYSDVCRRTSVGGIARGFFTHVAKHYGNKPVQYNFEAKVGEQILTGMLNRAEVKVALEERLAGVTKVGSRITELKTESGQVYRGRVFIDATYEGDLLAKAGVEYTFGRESRDQYQEQFAGVQWYSIGRQFLVPVSAFDAAGNLLPGIQERALPPLGSGDKKVMAYNFRLCMTMVEDNKLPITKPEGYDVKQYELLARFVEAMPNIKVEHVLAFHQITKDKVCLNRDGPFSTNFIGESWGWPEGSYAEREEIYERHKRYTQGLLYFLWNEERVPAELKRRLQPWGYCKDEFVDNDNWPHQLYVREARRMIGQHVLTEKDMLTDRFKDDVIGLASCPIEVHETQRVVKEDGTVGNEGFTFHHVPPYAIPYRSVTPKRNQADNLLVPVAVSASHVTYSSLRMEPVFMVLGQSTGVAANLAVKNDVAVQDVDIAELQKILRAQGQVL